MVWRWAYELMYRVGAPWEGPARAELVGLVESGRLTPGRAIDLGCGSGANAIFLAEHGFAVTGVDFSRVALDKARRAAAPSPARDRVTFVEGDLTAERIPGVEGPFDLVVDYGTLDDLRGDNRSAMARLMTSLTAEGGTCLLWCFYARLEELPFISFKGASRMAPPIVPGEETALFGGAFEIERLPEPPEGSRAACFLMTRRARRSAR